MQLRSKIVIHPDGTTSEKVVTPDGTLPDGTILRRKVEMRHDGMVTVLPRREVSALAPGDWCTENGHMKAWDGERWHNRPVDCHWHDGAWSTEASKNSSLDDLEVKLNLMKEARDVERAIDLCHRAVVPENETRILSIRAEGVAETERSIYLPLTIAESMAVFEMVSQQLAQRLEGLKQKLGVA